MHVAECQQRFDLVISAVDMKGTKLIAINVYHNSPEIVADFRLDPQRLKWWVLVLVSSKTKILLR